MAAVWDEHELRAFLRVFGDSWWDSPFAERYPHLLDPIVRLCLALRSGDYGQATRVYDEEASKMKDKIDEYNFDMWSLKCPLFFGVERDLRLVRYTVENRGLNRDEILVRDGWVGKRYDKQRLSGNALLFAIDNGKRDVVQYLLQDWALARVSLSIQRHAKEL